MDFNYGDAVEYVQADGTVVAGTVGAPFEYMFAVKVYRDDAPDQPGAWIPREFVRHTD